MRTIQVDIDTNAFVSALRNDTGTSFFSAILSERMAALRTREYLEQRASKGKREKFEKALAKVGNNHPPDENDIAIK